MVVYTLPIGVNIELRSLQMQNLDLSKIVNK